jgi:hypothetical protein
MPQSVVLDHLGVYVYTIQIAENKILFFIHILSLYLQELPVHVSEVVAKLDEFPKFDGK